MARRRRITFTPDLELFSKHFRKMYDVFGDFSTYENIIKAGCDPIADAIRENMEAIPVDKFRYLRNGDKFNVVDIVAKEAMLANFGVSPVWRHDGWYDAKIGWEGYIPYDDVFGIPFVRGRNAVAQVARSIDSGSSVRQKYKFVGPAVNRARRKAMAAMIKATDEIIEEIFKEA